MNFILFVVCALSITSVILYVIGVIDDVFCQLEVNRSELTYNDLTIHRQQSRANRSIQPNLGLF